MIFNKKEKEDALIFSGRLVRPRFQQLVFRISFFVIISILLIFLLEKIGVSGIYMYYVTRIGGLVFFFTLVISFFEKVFRKYVFVEKKENEIFLLFTNGEKIIISNEWGIHIFEGINFYSFSRGNDVYTVCFDVEEKKKFKKYLKETFVKTEMKKGLEYFLI